jgi:hypothetical protein
MNVIKTNYLRGVNLSIAELPLSIDSVSGPENLGCHLYIGITDSTQNSITVKNLSGDIVTFSNVLQGTILPFICTEIIDIDSVDGLVAVW